MGWQELMVILFIAVPYYFMWRMIRNRGASYWWMLLMLSGSLLGLIIGYFVIPRGDRGAVADRPDAP